MAVRAVLFDIDGTLVDSNGWHVRAWGEAFAAFGLTPGDEAIAAEIGKGADQLVPTLAPDAPANVREAIGDRHDALFKDRYLRQVAPFPDAAALVRRVHESGRTVVLASSASQAELDHYVALLGIGDCVAASTTSDDVDTSKPAPDIFGAALNKSGAAGDEARVIGDSPYDVDAAAAAGLAALAVLSGGFPADRLGRAVAIFRDVGELLARFDEVFAGDAAVGDGKQEAQAMERTSGITPIDKPGEASAEQGQVVLDGPDGVAITMTADAAERTAQSMLAAVAEARRQGG